MSRDRLTRLRPLVLVALLLAACERLRLPPARTSMIGDSVNDALAAQAAGCPVLLVETGYNEGDSVHSLAGHAGVAAIVPTLFDAAQHITRHLVRTSAPSR